MFLGKRNQPVFQFERAQLLERFLHRTGRVGWLFRGQYSLHWILLPSLVLLNAAKSAVSLWKEEACVHDR
jgi:hypothetical protein